jgi:pimeloyl-ACP methyl ester carboxylesterase
MPVQIHHEKVPGAHDLTLDLHAFDDALSGDASRTPLLFLHGFGHSAHIWHDFVPPLTRRYRVFALNARGHGGSDNDPQYRYHNAAHARDVGAVVDHMGFERVAIVGHSMGGHAAIRMGAFNEGRICRLMLVEASCEVPGNTKRESGQESMEKERSFASVAEHAELLARRYPNLRAEHVAQLAADWSRQRDDGRVELDIDPTFLRPKKLSDVQLRKDFDRNKWVRLESDKLWGYVETITCPTLILRGSESKMVPASAVERMANEVMADARAVTVEGAGHNLMLDAPEPFRKALLEFFLD